MGATTVNRPARGCAARRTGRLSDRRTGKQIAAVMREQSRAYNAMVITSDDEGQTWSECREAAAGVHRRSAQPRLCTRRSVGGCFPRTPRSLARPNSTLSHGSALTKISSTVKRGEYRVCCCFSIRATSRPKNTGDCGYAGLEVLPDGTFVATTYLIHKTGVSNTPVVSGRFNLAGVRWRVWPNWRV